MSGFWEVAGLSAAVIGGFTWLMVITLAPRAPGSPDPVARARQTRAWLLAPLWVTGLLVAAALLPGAVGVLSAELDHCLMHVDGHHHQLCWAHPPHLSGHSIAWLIPAVIALVALVRLGLRAAQVVRTQRLLAALVRSSRPSDLGPDVRLLDRAEPVAVAVGWRRPSILLSAGLIEQVDPATLTAVLAHERAHITRGDTRWALVERIAAALLPRRVARVLLDRLTLAREQACDALAAERAGGRVVMARALARVARLGPSPVGLSIAAGALEARVERLLAPPGPHRRSRLPWIALALLLVGLGPVHGVVEELVTALLH